jgi:hypothetical protein
MGGTFSCERYAIIRLHGDDTEHRNIRSHRHVKRKNCKHVICVNLVEYAESAIQHKSVLPLLSVALTNTDCYCAPSPRTNETVGGVVSRLFPSGLSDVQFI